MSRRESPPYRRSVISRAGFSLIELLVVLQVVILLIALIAPSLEAARGRSKHATCLSRLRDFGTASRIYQAGTADGQFLPVHPFMSLTGFGPAPLNMAAYAWGGKSGVGNDRFFSGSSGDPLNSQYGSRSGLGPSTRPMNPILYPNGFASAYPRTGFDRTRGENDTQLALDKFRCPADNGPPTAAHCSHWLENPERSSFDHFGTSYTINKMVAADVFGVAEIVSISPFLRPVSRVPNPARTIAYEENIGRFAWAVREDPCSFSASLPSGPNNAVRGWHGKNWTFNRSFIDTHAERVSVYIEGTEDQYGYANHYRVEKAFDDPNMQERYSCVIIRGDGWQLDTFPAPSIPTGFNRESGQRPSFEDCVFGFLDAKTATSSHRGMH